ncbi:Protein VAC14 homolog [Eumeta japonica]|uniref:Protein VAC14 homolog n=1 Tax=Eumeta variegata TaxID=151549 RepID=A0A4C1UZP3_EUMVA|nr:Protein VAC14 homolog [Eumeta japonica]
MSERDYAPLSIACVRGLCDKIYEKRKFAGSEIEKMVKDFNDANNTSLIKKLIKVLGQDLMSSTSSNVKNGALMGLSSVAVGLGKDCVNYLPELMKPIVACFSEADSRVRYQAAEAMYNVVKVGRGAVLAHFPLVFDALARLAADPEPQVKQGAELLDRLLKDIVTESGSLEVSALIPLVRERLYARNPFARQFVVSWVCVLDAVPHVDLIRHLPDLLDGLFRMLDDAQPDIRRMCELQLEEFLRTITAEPTRADLPAIVNILIVHAQASDETMQLTALTWLRQFANLAGEALLPHASGVLMAALPCLAYADDSRRNILYILYMEPWKPETDIRETAAAVNLQLKRLVGVDAGGEIEGSGLHVEAPVVALTQLLQHNSVHTKVAALDWLLHLYTTLPTHMFPHTDMVFGGLVASLADPSDDVVRRALAVLAEICSCRAPDSSLDASPYYHEFLRALLRLLARDEALLEDRGAFIIRQLCVLLNAEEVYRALSALLIEERDLLFVTTVVDVLSTILLTAAELYELRLRLRRFAEPGARRLFECLYESWCHSPVALLALCLLTHNYRHCDALIKLFGDLEVTVDFLTEVDKLVQLIESPIFAYLRLELLGGEESGALRSALYGLLMLLPQSEAFHALSRRLQCAPPPPLAAALPPPAPVDIDFEKHLETFRRVQAAHRLYNTAERARRAPHS